MMPWKFAPQCNPTNPHTASPVCVHSTGDTYARVACLCCTHLQQKKNETHAFNVFSNGQNRAELSNTNIFSVQYV